MRTLLDALTGQDWGERSRVGLQLHRADGAFAEQLAAAAHAVELATAGAIPVHPGHGCTPAMPALTITAPGRAPIHYLAVPAGPEAGPFVEALLALGRAHPSDGDCKPADVKIFIAAECPNCPRAVRSALRLAVDEPGLTVTVIDTFHFTELAGRYRVRSVPTTIIDDALTVVGTVSSAALRSHLAQPGSADHAITVLASLVDSARVDAAATELLGAHGPGALIELWRDSSMSRRLGLLLAAEQALEQDRTALDGAVAGLLPMLSSSDRAQRGDTADLLGRIAHPDARPALEALCTDDDPDVAEAARDALGDIGERAGATSLERESWST